MQKNQPHWQTQQTQQRTLPAITHQQSQNTQRQPGRTMQPGQWAPNQQMAPIQWAQQYQPYVPMVEQTLQASDGQVRQTINFGQACKKATCLVTGTILHRKQDCPFNQGKQGNWKGRQNNQRQF